MKLLTFFDCNSNDGKSRIGALLGEDSVLDLTRAAGLPADMLSFVGGGDGAWDAAREAISRAESGGGDEFILPLSGVRIAAPLGNPGKVICVGLNYHDHCREAGHDVPVNPILFAKFPSSIIGPGEGIEWPEGCTDRVDYEAELAFVMKKRCRSVTAEEAYDCIAGYTILNDVSPRDVQFADGQWVRAKSFDTFCPVGPYIVTPDEVGDPQRLSIRCWLNDQLVQDSNTSEMIFGVAEIVAFISKTSTLLPGDIIATGTPGGVGFGRKPPLFMKGGDVVAVAVEKLGRLENPVLGAV